MVYLVVPGDGRVLKPPHGHRHPGYRWRLCHYYPGLYTRIPYARAVCKHRARYNVVLFLQMRVRLLWFHDPTALPNPHRGWLLSHLRLYQPLTVGGSCRHPCYQSDNHTAEAHMEPPHLTTTWPSAHVSLNSCRTHRCRAVPCEALTHAPLSRTQHGHATRSGHVRHLKRNTDAAQSRHVRCLEAR